MRRFIGVLAAMAMVVGFAASAAAQDKAKIDQGAKLYDAQKCSICHSVAGKGNAKGPLEGVGQKYSAADLKMWLTMPKMMEEKIKATRKPAMKSYASLKADEVDAIVVYLQSLKK